MTFQPHEYVGDGTACDLCSHFRGSMIHLTEKPQPPEDLWEKLETALAECVPEMQRPPGSFTRAEYQAKFGLGVSGAKGRISKLLAAGKIRKLGKTSKHPHTYYVLANGKE